MPPKVPGERYRYIAFKIEGGQFARSDFLSALLHAARETDLDESFRITVFEENFGILKVPHKLKTSAIAALTSVSSIKGTQCEVRTLKTSGTILTLKKRFSEFIPDDKKRPGVP